MPVDALGNFRGKRLAVFGAGYVGLELVKAARQRGAEVVALTRNPAKADALRGTGATVVLADLATHDWHSQIHRADWVVNCVSSGGGGAAGYQRSYVEGMESILAWLKKAGSTDALVYTSSTSVYPQSGGVVDESSPTAEATGTAAILLAAEALVKQAAESRACARAVVLRLAGIYGPERHHILDQLRQNVRPLPGRGSHRLNLIYRDDIVSAVFAALGGAVHPYQVFNVVDDAPVRKSELVEWLVKRLRLPPAEFSGTPVPGRRPDPPDRVVSNARIKAQLSWSPRYRDYRSGYEAILGA